MGKGMGMGMGVGMQARGGWAMCVPATRVSSPKGKKRNRERNIQCLLISIHVCLPPSPFCHHTVVYGKFD